MVADNPVLRVSPPDNPIQIPVPSDELRHWYREKALSDPLRQQFESLRSRHICIMGGCGQVGSHIVAKLYELGLPLDHLYINDDLRLGIRDNLPPTLRDRVDIRTHLDYAQAPPPEIDTVIFVGGRSSAPHFESLQDVLEELETWTAVLNWCVAQQIRLVFATTSSLCKTRPSIESQRVWPGSLYELAKLTMEEAAIQQALSNGLAVQLCRFFSVYGVTEQHKGPYGNLYTQILWHAIAQQPFEVWGQSGIFAPGEQSRDIIFAPEVSRAILYLLTLPNPHPSLTDITALTYNIGQGQPVAVSEMIDQVASLLPASLRPIIKPVEAPPQAQNYVVHTWGDPSKLLQSGFQPIYTDHIQNLTFVTQVLLSEMNWYWSLLADMREAIAPNI